MMFCYTDFKGHELVYNTEIKRRHRSSDPMLMVKYKYNPPKSTRTLKKQRTAFANFRINKQPNEGFMYSPRRKSLGSVDYHQKMDSLDDYQPNELKNIK